MLKDAARSQPIVLIFDDLHEADHDSLEMLKFVARGLRDSQIVVIGNYRDVEVRRSQMLSDAIAELLREGDQVPLAGLAETEVARMVEAGAALAPSASFIADLHRATAGNPLFVDGVLRVLIAEGKLAGAEQLDLSGFKLPEGVRGTVRKRLGMLSVEALGALVVAAAIGQEFELALLQRLSQLTSDQLSDLTRESTDVGIIASLRGSRCRFTHPLIREALYKEAGAAEQIALHRRIGYALEEIYASDVSAHLAELAHHFRQSREIDKAIGYSIRAGDAACTIFAFEEAVSHWSAALELAEHQPSDDLRLADTLSRLGELIARGGNKHGIEYLERALTIYERRGQNEKSAELHAWLARYMGGTLLQTLDLSGARDHCAQAEKLLNGAPRAALSRAYFALAWIELWRVNEAAGLPAARRALEIGKALNDECLQAAALAAVAGCMWGRGKLREAHELFDASWEMGDRSKDLQAIGNAISMGSFSLNWLSDVGALKAWVLRELARPRQEGNPARGIPLHFAMIGHVMAGDIAEARLIQFECQSRYPATAKYNLPWLHYADGNFEAAETGYRSYLNFARRQGRRENVCCFGFWLGCLQITSRNYEEAEASFSEALSIANEGGHVPFQLNAWEGLAHTYVLMNRLDDARTALTRCHQITSDGEDWRGLVGHVIRTEALLEAAQGNWIVADDKFTEAVEAMRRHECFWERILTLREWGCALRDAGRQKFAEKKFDEAVKILEGVGAAQRWIDYVEAARRTAPKDKTSVAGQFRKEGHYWRVSFGDETFRLKDSKSVRVIVHLIRSPGYQFHARELAALDSPQQHIEPHFDENVAATVSSDLGDAGIVLDSQAVAEYRHRLEDLRSEIEEAERCNDLGRVSLLREEAEVLTAELAAGVGFQGRERRASSHSERARLSVTKNIRGAIEKIREANPALGRHLANSIKTGYLCSYSPDPASPIVWQS